MAEHDLKTRELQVEQIKHGDDDPASGSNEIQVSDKLVYDANIPVDTDYTLTPKWYVDSATPARLQFTYTSSAAGEVDLTAEAIHAFPVFLFYPTAGGPNTLGRYDSSTQLVDGLDPSTSYELIFM